MSKSLQDELAEALRRIVKIRQPCADPSADAVAMGYETEHIPECCRWCKARAALARYDAEVPR